MGTEKKEETAGQEASSQVDDQAAASQAAAVDTSEDADIWETIGNELISDDLGEVDSSSVAEEAAAAETQPEEQAAAAEDAASAQASEAESIAASQEASDTSTAEAAKPGAEQAAQKQEATAEKKEEASAAQAQPEPQPQQTREEWEAEILPQLQEMYSVSPEDAAAVLTDPEQELPKLAAKLHLGVFQHVVQAVERGLPEVIQQLNVSQQAQSDALKEFTDAWPELNDEDGMNTANRMIPMYLQMNPQATRAQVIQEVGASAMTALRRGKSDQQRQEEQQQQQSETQQQMQPQGSGGIPTNGLTTQSRPHVPAGAGRAVTSAPAQLGDFEQIAEELLEDDRSA